jgi:hypothetical protein
MSDVRELALGPGAEGQMVGGPALGHRAEGRMSEPGGKRVVRRRQTGGRRAPLVSDRGPLISGLDGRPEVARAIRAAQEAAGVAAL